MISRVGLKKIELKNTSSGQVFGISDAFRKVASTTIIRNPFDNIYVQLAQAPFHSGTDNTKELHARPQDLDEASMSVLVRARIIKEQINTLSKMTQEAERRIEVPLTTQKDGKGKSQTDALSVTSYTLACLFIFL